MTNPSPPRSSGGFPKWLIILLVILLFIILGCCGGVATCFHYSSKVASAGLDELKQAGEKKIKEAGEQKLKEAQAQLQAEMEKAEAERKRPELGAPADPTPGVEPTASKAPKMPANFPDDIPLFPGLVANNATADNIDNSGLVSFDGPGGTDPIAAFYEKDMVLKDWKIEKNTTFNDAHVLIFSKGPRRATVTVSPVNDQKTYVSIVYTSH